MESTGSGAFTVSQRRTFNGPIDRAWERLAQLDAIAQWAPDVEHSSMLTEQRDGVGAARRIQAGRVTLVETITEWQAPSGDETAGMAYVLEGLPPMVGTVINRWELRSVPFGVGTLPQTDITLTCSIQPTAKRIGRPLSRIMSRVMSKTLRSLIDGFCDVGNGAENE